MRIIIIGFGYVGKAMYELLNKYSPEIYDPKTHYKDGLCKEKFDLAVICVPTKMNDDGSCDTSIVEESIKKFQAELYLIKSTVTPTTTDKLKIATNKRIVFSPEYVGESKYFNPYFPDKMIETPFFIFGGEKRDTTKIVDLFLDVCGPAKRYLQMTSLEAEVVKYMENSFFAMKITFCQEMFDLCEQIGADWNTVREGWLADPRINPMHTAVFRNNRGFSGKCLPKDTNAIVRFADSIGVSLDVLKATLMKNKKYEKFK